MAERAMINKLAAFLAVIALVFGLSFEYTVRTGGALAEEVLPEIAEESAEAALPAEEETVLPETEEEPEMAEVEEEIADRAEEADEVA